MKRLITAVLAVLLLVSCAACGNQENTAPSSEASAGLFAMDTYLNLTAYGKSAETALEQAQNRIRKLERLWSVTDEQSEIYAANHSGGEAVTVSEDTACYACKKTGAWYAEAVMYCREHGLMAGIGNNLFAPGAGLTRAQLATVLYRIEGAPAVTGTDDFTDTDDGAWMD